MAKIVIKHLSEEEIKKKEIRKWPTWEKEQSVFPWVYSTEEECYIIEGKIEVTDKDGNVYKIKENDFVVFPKGLECTWKIIEPVKKYYNFS